MRNLKKVILKHGEEYVEIGFAFPYYLTNAEGLHQAVYDLETSDNYGIDGTTVTGSKQQERPITIEAKIKDHFTERREKLYRTLPEGDDITVVFTDEAGESKAITARVEEVSITAMGFMRDVEIELLCPNPFFRDEMPTYYDMAGWIGGLEFDVDLTDANELETRIAEQIKVLSNPSNVEIPLKITFRANGPVKRPTLMNVTTDELMQIDVDMNVGDVLAVNTERGVRSKIVLNGASANNKWIYGSTWLRLPIGDSVFKYDAESGVDNLDVEIETYTLYRGA